MRIFSPNDLKKNLKAAMGAEAFSGWNEKMDADIPDEVNARRTYFTEHASLLAELAGTNGCMRLDLVRTSVERFDEAMEEAYFKYGDIVWSKPAGVLTEAQSETLKRVAYIVYEWRYARNCGFLLDGILACFCEEIATTDKIKAILAG